MPPFRAQVRKTKKEIKKSKPKSIYNLFESGVIKGQENAGSF